MFPDTRFDMQSMTAGVLRVGTKFDSEIDTEPSARTANRLTSSFHPSSVAPIDSDDAILFSVIPAVEHTDRHASVIEVRGHAIRDALLYKLTFSSSLAFLNHAQPQKLGQVS